MCSIVVLTWNQFLINWKPLYCPCELVSFTLVSVYLSLKSCSLVLRGGPGEAKGQVLLSCWELGICGGERRAQNLTFLRISLQIPISAVCTVILSIFCFINAQRGRWQKKRERVSGECLVQSEADRNLSTQTNTLSVPTSIWLMYTKVFQLFGIKKHSHKLKHVT